MAIPHAVVDLMLLTRYKEEKPGEGKAYA